MDMVKNGTFKTHILQLVRTINNKQQHASAEGHTNPAFSIENISERNFLDAIEKASENNVPAKTKKTNSEKDLSKCNISSDRTSAEFRKRRSAVNMSVRSNYELSTKSPFSNNIDKMVSLEEQTNVEEAPDPAHMEKLIRRLRSPRAPAGDTRSPQLQRSDYSLVSCADLTPGSVEVWSELPDQVKYDPALARFRERFEVDSPRKDLPVEHPQPQPSPVEQSPAPPPPPILSQEAKQHAKCIDDTNGVEIPRKGPSLFTEKLRDYLLYVKLSCLLAAWLFFTAAFIMFEEKEAPALSTALEYGVVKEFNLTGDWVDEVSALVQLNGPLMTAHQQSTRGSHNDSRLTLWLETWIEADNGQADLQISQGHHITFLPDDRLDFHPGVDRESRLTLAATPALGRRAALYLNSTARGAVPLRVVVTARPLAEGTGIVCALLLLVVLYVMIIFEVVNRTLAAMIVASCSLGVLAVLGQRPSLPELVSWLDVETLLLLFSMMLLVAITAETGLFDFIAVFTFSVTKGRVWPLINLLCFFTAVLSSFLDNVTTVLLMSPVTIRLCELMELNPVPVLMAIVIYSNIGGTATPVGDPPNVIIASNQDVIDGGIHFATFTGHMLLGIVFVSIQTYLQLKFYYRDPNSLRLGVPKDVQEMTRQIAIWRRASSALPAGGQDEEIVRRALDKKVRKLEARLGELVRERRQKPFPDEAFQDVLAALKDKYKIRDRVLLYKSTCAIVFVVVVFFLHSLPELKRVSLGWTALLGAILLLILLNREDLEGLLSRVEWSTLLFFAALFVLMEALAKLGLIAWIGGLTEDLIMMVDERARLAVAILLILWISGVASAFVDNIPLTTMMVRVATSLGNNPALGLPLAPLVWALSFGACLGGNGTLIGASANVVTAGVAQQHGYRLSFTQFFRLGFPIMLGHLVVATVYLLVCHCLFQWH